MRATRRKTSEEYMVLPDGQEAHWEVVERILFIYAKLNPGQGYVQVGRVTALGCYTCVTVLGCHLTVLCCCLIVLGYRVTVLCCCVIVLGYRVTVPVLGSLVTV